MSEAINHRTEAIEMLESLKGFRFNADTAAQIRVAVAQVHATLDVASAIREAVWEDETPEPDDIPEHDVPQLKLLSDKREA